MNYKEVWKDVKGYEGRYQVSNLGNVKTLNFMGRGIETNLKKSMSPQGYEVVRVGDKLELVHRLVAEAFIENPNNYPIVNHIDENKTNNMASNLEWRTHKYNLCYGKRLGKVRKPVIAITKQGEAERYGSVKSASEAMGVTPTAISQALIKGYACKGRKWLYEGQFCSD